MNKEEIMKKLQEPFNPEDIEWRIGSTTKDKTRGLALAYVTNRAIQNRLDEVVGPFNWKNEYKEWKGNSQLCGISIWDDEKKEWITKWDGASDTDFEATKGGLSDSMKRAAYQWGIGRYLYKLPAVWVPIKQVGKSYVLAETPDIPKEFLPKDYKSNNHNKTKQNSNKITEKQVDELEKLIELKGVNKEKVLSFYKVKDITEMTQEQFQHCRNYLAKK